MKPWNEESSPNQATPTNSTWPSHLMDASSTEGASRLHVLQVGAQNHSATVLPEYCVKSIDPPPTSGAANCNASGAPATGVESETVELGTVASTLVGVTEMGSVEVVPGTVGAESLEPDSAAPQPASNMPVRAMAISERCTSMKPTPRSLCGAMRTRTLLLLAIGCGLMILLAGGIQLLRLANQDSTPPLGVGDTGKAGDVTITVDEVQEADSRLIVSLVIGGIDDDDALEGFTLVGVPAPVSALADAGTCSAISLEPVSCTVVFPTDAFTTADRQLLFIRAEQQVRWILV